MLATKTAEPRRSAALLANATANATDTRQLVTHARRVHTVLYFSSNQVPAYKRPRPSHEITLRAVSSCARILAAPSYFPEALAARGYVVFSYFV